MYALNPFGHPDLCVIFTIAEVGLRCISLLTSWLQVNSPVSDNSLASVIYHQIR